MSARDLATHLERLSAEGRREVFERLAAEFAPAEPEESELDLYMARARLLAL